MDITLAVNTMEKILYQTMVWLYSANALAHFQGPIIHYTAEKKALFGKYKKVCFLNPPKLKSNGKNTINNKQF